MTEKATEISAMQTVDGVPMAKGMRVYLVDDARIGRYEDSLKPARPIEATVLRISDGHERSLLLRRYNGVETRWYPKPHHIEAHGLFASLNVAKAFAKRKNQEAFDEFQQEARKEIKRYQNCLKKFRRLCRLWR